MRWESYVAYTIVRNSPFYEPSCVIIHRSSRGIVPVTLYVAARSFDNGSKRNPNGDIPGGATPKILILDDHVDSRLVLGSIFERRRYGQVLAASRPQEAIELCERHADIDLFVCDVILGGPITGIETALQVHACCPGMALLFTSGTALEGFASADFENLRTLLSARVDFIQKPFTAAALIEAADRLVQCREPSPTFLAALQAAENARRFQQRPASGKAH